MGFSLKRFAKSVSKRVIKPVFNPVKDVANIINDKILNPALIKPFEKMQDGTKFMLNGGPMNYVKDLSEIFRLQMLGLPADQIGEHERTKLQKFLELKASPKIEKVRSIGQLGHSMALVINDINDQLNAIRLAKESGALDFSEEGKINYNTDLGTFKQFMENKRRQELEANRGAGPEGIESLINRVQELGQSTTVDVAQAPLNIETGGNYSFTPTNSNFSSFLSKVQGPSKPSSSKGK